MPSVIIDHRKQQLDLFGPPPGPMPVINPDGVSIKGCRTISQATDWRSFTLRMIDLFNRLGACYDQHGNIALVGECCSERLHEVYTAGLYSCRNYDFLPAGEHSHGRGLGNAKVAHLLDLCQRAIADADENVKDDMWQRGGVSPPPHALISVLPRPWKQDDRLWFERHSKRSHRARFPFPGEVEPQHADAQKGTGCSCWCARSNPVSASSSDSSLTNNCCQFPTPKPSRMRCSTLLPGTSRCRATARRCRR